MHRAIFVRAPLIGAIRLLNSAKSL